MTDEFNLRKPSIAIPRQTKHDYCPDCNLYKKLTWWVMCQTWICDDCLNQCREAQLKENPDE